ncbi:unnamed protein product [Peniophora sp. CBMAI 1063]|nr:unnamed protein product [Peniophora sp. CBMAI 1063]
MRPPRAPLLMRDRYEGVDSDDETDSDSAYEAGAESDEENQPQIVDDMGRTWLRRRTTFLISRGVRLGLGRRSGRGSLGSGGQGARSYPPSRSPRPQRLHLHPLPRPRKPMSRISARPNPEEIDIDIEAAMDQELRAALSSSSTNPDDDDDDYDYDYDGEVDEDGLPLNLDGGLH